MSQLRILSRLYGVQPGFRTADGRVHRADPEALISVLRSLGASVYNRSDVSDAIAYRRQQLADRVIAPCNVLWQADEPHIFIRTKTENQKFTLTIQYEDGNLARKSGQISPKGRCPILLPHQPPNGYHRLQLETGGAVYHSHLIVAPKRCYQPTPTRRWGVFAPLYAYRSQRCRAFGGPDYQSLVELGTWVAEKGGDVVATLPLYAQFLEESAEPSPYSPISKLMWNELYLDLQTLAADLQDSPVPRFLTSNEFLHRSNHLADQSHANYEQWASHRRPLLESLAQSAWQPDAPEYDALQQFVATTPYVADYARFRATGARHGICWKQWPEPAAKGDLSSSDWDAAEWRFHCYVQWQCNRQLAQTQAALQNRGCLLYLDLPVGVHGNGFDAWQFRSIMAPEMSAGAPPDTFFVCGQDWSTPVLDPEKSRESGHAYFSHTLRTVLRYADIVRIDHVMALHRLFWVPRGYSPKQGVYVHYPAEELYAILALESHRNQCVLVGEDLGTVPAHVRSAMTDKGLRRMYIGQYELVAKPGDAPSDVVTNTVASLNTHDMPTFAGFCTGRDLIGNLQRGEISTAEKERQQSEREKQLATLARLLVGESDAAEPALWPMFVSCLTRLAKSDAWLLLVSAEDLWLETDPQNVPGTSAELPNWRRKFAKLLEHWDSLPGLREILERVNAVRNFSDKSS